MSSTFIIQYHQAKRAGPHYDLYLEDGAGFRSWAVPKGIPTIKGVKHLAIEVNEHSSEAAFFEGTIPTGQYGAGTKEVFDEGTYIPYKHIIAPNPIRIDFFGSKVKGRYYLKHWKNNHWLIWRT